MKNSEANNNLAFLCHQTNKQQTNQFTFIHRRLCASQWGTNSCYKKKTRKYCRVFE